MRRIPRPLRATDPALAFQLYARRNVALSPCHSAVATCTNLRTSTAAFSTTSSNAFLLPSGKQDKKKHQQFVRRWQKRLLGDSEPIGARVDPYDPTSPVRIAPEEQGEEEEVLEDSVTVSDTYRYLPAEDMGLDRPGRKLLHVGGPEWQRQRMEVSLAKDFEKLMGRTYAPLSIRMANEIENMTGSLYTLRDENLMLGQEMERTTGRPYTDHNFGLLQKLSKPKDIYPRFTQAVTEVYTLKEAGLELDISKAPNRGIYDTPPWIHGVTFRRTSDGQLALDFPIDGSAQQLLEVMHEAPEWNEAEALGEEEVLVDEAADLLEPVLPQEPAPTMDPATPEFKRHAVVKADPNKKPFDFMSNRPTPRSAPVAPAEPAKEEKATEKAVKGDPAPELSATVPASMKISQFVVNEMQQVEDRAQNLARDFAALKRSVHTVGGANKWRTIPVNDIVLKFALFKRLYQLTGIRISDPHLTASNTLGDIYGYLCAAAKPKPTSLYSTIQLEAKKAQERADQQSSTQSSRKKANLADLLALGNVEVRRVQPDKVEKRTKIGLQKSVDRALGQRRLRRDQSREDILENTKPISDRDAPWLHQMTSRRNLKELARTVPDVEKPLSSRAANLLLTQTKREIDGERERTRLR